VSRANAAAVGAPVIQAELARYVTLKFHEGMTIRERFAMAALQGIIASGRNSSSVVLDVAAEAREYADALIDELEREPRE
jgi:hypothetical protein